MAAASIEQGALRPLLSFRAAAHGRAKLIVFPAKDGDPFTKAGLFTNATITRMRKG